MELIVENRIAVENQSYVKLVHNTAEDIEELWSILWC